MPETRIDAAVSSTSQHEDFSVGSQQTGGPTGQEDFEWMNTKFTSWLGYYRTIPELTSVIDAKATWTVGKGVIADETTIMLLDTIKGRGKDTFNTIIENCVRTYHIGGDSFCEIVRDDEENLINLKVLDPSTIKIITNKEGIIKRYEQMNKITKKTIEKWQPEEIFHLARNVVADNIHGVSIVERLVEIILMKNEAMADDKIISHRFAYPQWIFHLDTDDETEIATFKKKHDAARSHGENMYIPKDVVVPELVAVAPNATINLQPRIDNLDSKFYEAAQVPKIIVGGVGGITEAAVKIAYLAWEQTIREEQLFINEQVLSQLNLLIELEFPASLENELISDNNKDAESGATQPNDTEAGSGE